MPALEIGQLSLKLSGLSEEEGKRLVRLIAEGLAESPLRNGVERSAMASNQTAPPGTSVESLSRRIVEDLLRQLDRSV